jgi:2'-5' RNA ligase
MAESALIVPVDAAESYVGRVREQFDRTVQLGVPAHITVLYPFVPPERIDDALLDAVQSTFSRAQPFSFVLSRIGRFAGPPASLHLAPEPAAPFIALTESIVRRFPEHPPYGGQFDDVLPHLTVAYGTETDLQAAEELLRAALPGDGGIAATCRAAALIENTTGWWRHVRAFAFGPAGAARPG